MAINYTTLVGAKEVEGSIRYWAQHSLLPVDNILLEAQALIYSKLRVREMQETAAVSALVGASSIACPAGFQDPIKLMIDGYGKLTYKREDDFPDIRDENGDLPEGFPPSCWTVVGPTIFFDVKLNEALAGDLTFYGTPAPLAATTNETNFLTTRFPTLLRRACLAFAYEARHRPAEFTAEIALVEKAIAEANATVDMTRYGQVL